ncbi:MAG: AAA family ATPase [Kofleriaceae bacterium]|nr:AAA family ATPase [Kofleriaceae bacterium]MBP6836893.1 AAA family ATPase [Kofleriaceae bacterium]
MSELIVLSGLQAAGKSTFYAERFAATHALVSKDLWPNARNRERRQRLRVDEHLAGGRAVVVDNTNPTRAERAPLVALALAHHARAISYAFLSSVDDALARNAARVGRARVRDVGILSVAKVLTQPDPTEGFTDRFLVRLTATGFVVTRV